MLLGVGIITRLRKKYEFGVNVSVAATAVGNWCVGSLVCPNNPYDGHTLAAALEQVGRLTGVTPKHAYCDLGYRGSGYQGEVKVHIVDRRKKAPSAWERRWWKRRAAVEPIIGHLKTDHRMDRNFYRHSSGDRVNALLSGAGYNLNKLLAVLSRGRTFLFPYFTILLHIFRAVPSIVCEEYAA
ncbi:MAG: hypothetical protein A2284_04870 [Deltaproteobacteria bacterium RIFOXYA12_FULL_61_11]|nr:MAG: hypothetical protein A2284_04870 [Deltaproteobacteria bacterium RIFOXYA12_FULL_61_11]